MQKLRFNAPLVGLFFITFCFNIELQANEHDISKIIEESKKIAKKYADIGWFSGSLLVTKDNEVIHQQAFGYADLKLKRKNTVATKYNLGSIAKNFTTVLILQQVQAGKISLDDPLQSFGLGFPKDVAKNITIRHLLNHRSGFDDIFIGEYRQNQMAFDSIDKKLALLMDKPLLFTPGSDQKYSNYGYIVLGSILEKISHKSYPQLLDESIFKKLSMSGTTFLPTSGGKNQSTRYTYSHEGKLVEVGITEHPGPDGGIESTIEDVQLFYRELFYGNRLLRKGNGVVKEIFNADQHWGAFSGGLGISAAVEVDLKNGFEVVVLANSDNLIAERISNRILFFINSRQYAPIKTLRNNFTYQYYKEHGIAFFVRTFKDAYQDAGYETFIGRTINELGMQLLRSESWTEAFDMFDTLIAFFPEAPQAYDSLAFAHYSKGEKDKALAAFEIARTLNPDFNSDYHGRNFE